MRRAAAAAALLTLAGAACGAPEDRAPEARTGPYRVVVDRITHNPSVAITYPSAPAKGKPQVEARRTVQLQVAVYAADAAAATSLATFQIASVSAEVGGRVGYLPHYGGTLENPNESAAVRAYLYLPGFPALAREIRALEGAVVAYPRSELAELEIPTGDGSVPRTVERGGVRATLREFALQGATAQLSLSLEGAADSVLLNTTSDGTYGISLVGPEGRPATPSGATMVNPRANQAEYRATFQGLRGAPARVRVRFLHRSGERRTYPFRIERIRIPTRAAAGEQRQPQ